MSSILNIWDGKRTVRTQKGEWLPMTAGFLIRRRWAESVSELAMLCLCMLLFSDVCLGVLVGPGEDMKNRFSCFLKFGKTRSDSETYSKATKIGKHARMGY